LEAWSFPVNACRLLLLTSTLDCLGGVRAARLLGLLQILQGLLALFRGEHVVDVADLGNRRIFRVFGAGRKLEAEAYSGQTQPPRGPRPRHPLP
jgi:hypothetical protein